MIWFGVLYLVCFAAFVAGWHASDSSTVTGRSWMWVLLAWNVSGIVLAVSAIA